MRKKCRYTNDGYLQLNRTVTDMDIIEMYRRLWKIEETFKVIKTNMSAMPVFVWNQDHIRAHFLICFVSLVLFQLLEYKFDWKYTATEKQDNLARACGSRLEQNLFVFDHYTSVLEDIGKATGIDFSRKCLTTGVILPKYFLGCKSEGFTGQVTTDILFLQLNRLHGSLLVY